MDPTSGVYIPIQPYQTRIIRLHGDNEQPSSPLVCELLVADILHPSFEGLGLRSQHGDRLVEFHALSYTWDGQQSSEVITCNDKSFFITRNLHDALQALRLPSRDDRFLWADALCINQRDDIEKSIQVRNMLSIYQKASKVIAWLGLEENYVGEIVKAQDNKAFHVEEICKGLHHLYTRSWFRRIWVQQEILAARDLTLRSGAHEFRWFHLLSKPQDLVNVTQLKAGQQEDDDMLYGNDMVSKTSTTIYNARSLEIIDQLNALYARNLGNFTKYNEIKAPNLDLIDTLLETGKLDATDDKDHIYGILGKNDNADPVLQLCL
jgi:hypothetical protein